MKGVASHAKVKIVALCDVDPAFMEPAAKTHPDASRHRDWRELLGGLASVAGFVLAYQWDLPVGPTDVALLGVVCGLGNGLRWCRRGA